MRLFSVFILSFFLSSFAFAGKGRQPCSGAKGGIKYCTNDHKFMCRDGSISASKKKCLK